MEPTTTPFNLVIIISTAICSFYGFTRPGFADRWLFDVQTILKKSQYFRIITSAFLHGSWLHLIFNMYALYSFGTAVERLFGPAQFLLIYFTAIIGGNLLSLALHKNHEYRALGASGGVCGIIFACIFLLPGSSVYIFPIPFAIPAHIFAVIFILASYFGLRTRAGNIGHDAHLGGAIIGLAVTTIMHPTIIKQNPVLYPVVMSLAALLFLSLYLFPNCLTGSSQGLYERLKNIQPGIKNHSRPDSQKEEEILNRLLKKVSESGINSLTKRQKKQLREISKRRQKRG